MAAFRKQNTTRNIQFGGRRVIIHGLNRPFWPNLYHATMTISWPGFFAGLVAVFLALNVVFAGFYLAGDAAIAHMAPPGFAGAFFFSVETLATVGYGDMHPQTLYGHVVATSEIFIGMMSIALITGVMFARFSRPRALIIFSRHPVVRVIDGQNTLMLRAANARMNTIVGASAKLRLLRDDVSPEGFAYRHLFDLALRRDQQPLFTLGWTLMHVIDERSPLYGLDVQKLAAMRATLILTLEGVDETTVQTMQSRQIYTHDQILWSHRHVDYSYVDADGVDHMDFNRFDEVEPI